MKKLLKTLTAGGFSAALAISASFAEPTEDDSKKSKAKKAADPAARYAKLDKDKDGFVTAEELKAGFKKKPEMAEKFMKRKDKDGDGKLSKEEFLAKPKPKKKKEAAESKGSE